nr:hypothetical protein [Streptomyces fodineus]
MGQINLIEPARRTTVQGRRGQPQRFDHVGLAGIVLPNEERDAGLKIEFEVITRPEVLDTELPQVHSGLRFVVTH